MLSVRNCRTSLARLAPSAARTATSRRLPAARDSSKFATFAHAMSSTKLTALSNTSNAGRMSPLIISRRPIRFVRSSSLFVFGYAKANRAAIVFISVCACCRVTPGFRRAITRK